MKSRLPKVLQPLAGWPLIRHVVEAARSLNPQRIVVVIGHGADAVRSALDELPVEFVVQEEQKGTGHAVACCRPTLRDFTGQVLVLYGDNPLIRPETLSRLTQAAQTAAASLLTVESGAPEGYGRILRDEQGNLRTVVEHKDASPEERAITEVNAGSSCYQAPLLFDILPQVSAANSQGEYYLTDVFGLLIGGGHRVVPVLAAEEWETLGVDSRRKLAQVAAIFRDRTVAHWMEEGVSFLDPRAVWLDVGVRIGRDTEVLPQTILQVGTTIGAGCRVGPGVRLEDCQVGNRVHIEYAVARSSQIGDDAQLGPFCSLRPGTVVERGAKIGTFVETKQTRVGEGSKVPHLSYMGDAEIGPDVNVGAGSITCNFDGKSKHRTVIEEGAFIGSDTMFVAPVRIGKGATTGAGSVVREDVPPGGLVVGVPARKVKRAEEEQE